MTKGCLTVLAFLWLPGAIDAQDKGAKKLITKEAQEAIDGSLKYLAKKQAADGSWGTDKKTQNVVAISSLAGLALLSGGHVPDEGEYGKAVAKAVSFVLSQENKLMPGLFCPHHKEEAPNFFAMYNHGFAVLFLANMHEVTKDKEEKAKLKKSLERAVKLLVDGQRDEGMHAGGWRYRPQKDRDADLSVTACQIVALAAARDAGVEVPKKTLDKALDYVKRCNDPRSGGFTYQPGGITTFTCSAAALTSLRLLGVKEDKMIDRGLVYMHKSGLKYGDHHYFYGHYYGAKAMWYAGDKEWEKWYPHARKALVDMRQGSGKWLDNEPMGDHYCTAMALIVLQMPHGHLPSLRR